MGSELEVGRMKAAVERALRANGLIGYTNIVPLYAEYRITVNIKTIYGDLSYHFADASYPEIVDITSESPQPTKWAISKAARVAQDFMKEIAEHEEKVAAQKAKAISKPKETKVDDTDWLQGFFGE